MTYSDESYGGCNLGALPHVVMVSLHVLYDLGYGQGHDSHRAD